MTLLFSCWMDKSDSGLLQLTQLQFSLAHDAGCTSPRSTCRLQLMSFELLK
jgi:hypothetical protein